MTRERHDLWVWSALLALSCGHADGSTPPAAHAPTRPAAHAAHKSAGEHSPDAALEQDRIEAFMAEHFAIVTWARDMVISGDLESMRDPLRQLATYEYRTVAPGGWMPFVADLQQAARLTSEAKTLDLAATGVATMARVCGDCHRAKAAGPQFPASQPDHERATSDSLGERMQRHMWAVNRMWEGLTAPSDDAWNAGAQVLASAPAAAPESTPKLPPAVVSALSEVREVGSQALGATSLKDRANTFGLLLSTCATCHSHQVQLVF